MKFIIRGPFRENIYNLMRKIGYHFQRKDEKTNELTFARPPRSYPRFHLFLKQEDGNLVFSLHLDQKRPVYQGTPAHSGEYEGEVVEKEAERIKQILKI
jgi:hypothetical protein